MGRGKRTKAKTPRPDPVQAAANDAGVPEAPAARANLNLVEVANRADADQRHTVRSGQRMTVRRSAAPLDRYLAHRAITQREFDAGDWWRVNHHLGRYDTTKTANYEPRSAGGFDPLAAVVPFAEKVADARRDRRLIERQLSRADIATLDALCLGAFVIKGRAGQLAFVAARLALRRLAHALKLPG